MKSNARSEGKCRRLFDSLARIDRDAEGQSTIGRASRLGLSWIETEFKKAIHKFDFRAFNELAQIGRSWEMAVTETAPPTRNSDGSNHGTRNIEDREKRNGNKLLDNGRKTGFAKNRFGKSEKHGSLRNFKGIRGDFKVGGVSNV